MRVCVQKQNCRITCFDITVEIGDREGKWTPTPREVIVELVGVGEQRFPDDGRGRSLKF
ncbi:hypothetical protein [Nodularia spumigena]|jgi:alpha-glucosidase|uniref:hypothetical protein n=1 Tax=Nodularia spumigena TaxID=70799 RepID=UPI00131F0BBB|nr:hypothetical protein [Nodularia spumigena]MDB9326222.1 hypothetical protein [Nodularia spumigena CS-590/02]